MELCSLRGCIRILPGDPEASTTCCLLLSLSPSLASAAGQWWSPNIHDWPPSPFFSGNLTTVESTPAPTTAWRQPGTAYYWGGPPRAPGNLV